MAKKASHCLYHMGFIKHYKPKTLYLHSSSDIGSALKAYNLKSNSEIYKISSLKLVYLFILMLATRSSVHILGINLRFLLILMPLIVLRRCDLTVHLHGQAYALFYRGSIKFKMWQTISIFCNLVVANPAFEGPSFVKRIKNLNFVRTYKRPVRYKNRKVKIGSIHKLEKVKFEYKKNTNFIYQLGSEYSVYVKTLMQCQYLWLEFSDKYYNYSPSGRISDALNFSQIVIINAKENFTETAKEICKAYGVPFILMDDFFIEN